ncbi:hypothetical protein MRX96_030485 [Rhipicephalus microplus]
MLERAYPVVISGSAVSQATSRDPALSQVVKALSRGEESVQEHYNLKATELSLKQGCLLWGFQGGDPTKSPFLGSSSCGTWGIQLRKRQKWWPSPMFGWPGLDQDIAHMVRSCQVWEEHQRASRHVETTLRPFS